MSKPTKKQIQSEIKKLTKMKPKVRHFSAFGTDNQAQIAAQIDVLKNDLDNDEIFDKYDHSGTDEEILGVALDARSWLDGEYENETLSEDWESLIK